MMSETKSSHAGISNTTKFKICGQSLGGRIVFLTSRTEGNLCVFELRLLEINIILVALVASAIV